MVATSQSNARLSGRDLSWCLGLGALALLLRVLHVFSMRSNPAFEAPIMDALYHVEWARAVADGRAFQEGPFFRAPLYPWFLGTLMRLFGDGLLVPRLVQAVLGSAATMLTFLLARRAFDDWTARLAGLGAATYWVLIYFDGELLIPTLIVPLNLAALYWTIGLRREGRPASALVSGLLFGLSAIARPNVLLVLPVIALWLLRRAGWKSAAWLTLGTLLPIAPITLHNLQAGDPALISTQAGVNFWIGNNPTSDGSTAIVPGTRGGWWEGYYDAIAQAEAAQGAELRPSQVSRYYSRRAWDWIASEPAAATQHLLWKLRLFWMNWELGNNQEVRFFAYRFDPLLRWLPLNFALLAGLGGAGFLASLLSKCDRKRREERFPLAAFLLIYSASVVAFFVCSRFRVPVLPLLIIFAAHGGLAILRDWRRGARPLAALWLAVACVGSLLSYRLPEGVKTSEANGYWQLGVYDLGKGDLRSAEGHLRYASQLDPGNLFARSTLARLLTERGEFAAAEAELRAAFSVDPERMDTWDAWFELKLRQGALVEVVGAAEEILSSRPHLASPHFHLARVAQQRDQFSQAVQAARACLARDPQHFGANWLLATLLLEGGSNSGDESSQRAEARAALERILERGASAPPGLVEEARKLLDQARQ